MSEEHVFLLVEDTTREPVHAERLASGAFRLISSPGFAQGIAAGDEFRLLDSTGAFQVTHRPGNIAVRLFASSPVPRTPRHSRREFALLAAGLTVQSNRGWFSPSR